MSIRTDDILAGCPGKPEVIDYEKIVDDVIQWSGDLESAFFRICNILSHCSKAGMVFSSEKFQFAMEEVEFAGFVVGKWWESTSKLSWNSQLPSQSVM